MKRIFLFATAMLMVFAIYAQPYGIMVNGSKFLPGTQNPSPQDQNFQEYMVLGASINQGDKLTLHNQGTSDSWVVKLDDYSTNKIILSGSEYVCNETGCYDFYIKLKYGEDQLYIGEGKCSGSDDPVPGGNADYYLCGHINGADYASGEVEWSNPGDYHFVDGKLTATFTDVSYVYVKTGDCKNWFMAAKYVEPAATASVQLFVADEVNKEKVGVPAGVEVQFVLTENGDGTLTLSYATGDNPIPDPDPEPNPDPDPDPEPNPDPEPEPDPEPQRPHYGTAVPSQCTDVMLQAFYWDSNTDNGHGDTKWKTLSEQAAEIAANFDIVWLPPSAKSSGGVGYLPKQYSNQNSAWGSRADLEKLIATLRANDTKVIADIVINHADNKSTWCDFFELDFGKFGKFQPDASWICQNDEVNSQSSGACKGKATGKNDDGYGDEANYAAARDWDHDSEKVRQMCRAYLQWMIDEMHFDGFRYDYCKGFHGSHVNDYNSAADAYFSVTEYWDGNSDVLQSFLNDCQWNTLTFDFATKYEALNRGIAAGNYAGCKGSGLLGKGKSKYAVTFVDSHDSYQRDENEFGGKGKSMTLKDKLLQANAFILSMPGVPCVFYPHWKEYKSDIQKMIFARHAVGVHSESAVTDDTDNGGYHAHVTGKNGSLHLYLNQSSTCPSGFKEAGKGNGWAIYYKQNNPTAPTLVISKASGTYTDKVEVELSLIGDGDIYYTIDGTTPTSSSTKYTGKLTFTSNTTLKAIGVNGSLKTDVKTCEYTIKPRQTWPITVKFYNSGNWSKVYLYTWSDELLGKWPGTELSSDNDGWYAYTFDANVKAVNFIFNGGNGKPQTSDLYTEEDVCYSWSGGAEKLEETCTYTAIKEVVYEEKSLNIFPNPVTNVLNIQAARKMTAIELVSFTGQKILSQEINSDNAQVSVSALQQGLYLVRVQMSDNSIATTRFIKQ